MPRHFVPIGTCTERARSLAAAFCQSVSLRTTCFEEVCGLSPNAQTSSGAGVLAHAALLLTGAPAQTCLLVASDFLQRFHGASACLLQLSPETWDEANPLPACIPNSFASLSQSWTPGLSRSIPALPGRVSMCTDTQLDDEDDGTSPSCQLCHDWYMGVRVGEASHPGPKNPKSGDGIDLMSVMGPELLKVLREAITTMVQQAVQQSLGIAGSGQPVQEKGRNARRRKAKLRKAALRKSAAGGTAAGTPGRASASAQSSGPAPALSTSNGKGKGKGKGKADGNKTPAPKSEATNEGEWQLIQRQKPKDVEFMLRPQDWSGSLMMYGDLAANFDKADHSGLFEAVVHCCAAEIPIAERMLQASGRKFSVLLVAVDLPKRELDGHELAKRPGARQSIPGRIGSMIKFREGLTIQCTSGGCAAPQPKGIRSAYKVEVKETCILFVKVPQLFTSPEKWKAFTKNPKHAIATWASSHHVQLTDSWKWAEEKTANDARQVYGILRTPKADAPTLLALSGNAGVFVFPPAGQRENVTVQWVDRIAKESDRDYMARVARTQTIGLACHGSRLKLPITADAQFARIWQLNGCPRHWGMMQVTAIAEAHFRSVKMIRQNVRGSEKTFLFRGAAKEGAGCDLVPIAAEDGDCGGEIMLWACVAPARREQVKQKRLRNGPLPFVSAQADEFPAVVQTVAVPAPVSQKPEGDVPMDDESSASTDRRPAGAPTSAETATKKQKVTLRAIPAERLLKDAPKDGNCLFHAIGDGLRWLKNQPDAFHHLDMRARVADHLDRRQADYEPAWAADGRPGPDGKPVDTWPEFVAQVASPGKYSGEVELRALCRLFSIRVALLPADPMWKVCAYGRAKHKDVIVVYYKDQHFDFVQPHAKYAKEFVSVTADPNGGFLVGGVSEACSDSTTSHPRSQARRNSRSTQTRTGQGVSLARTGTAASSRCSRPVRKCTIAKASPARGRGMSVAQTDVQSVQSRQPRAMASVKPPAPHMPVPCPAAAAEQGPAAAANLAAIPEPGKRLARPAGRPRLVQWSQAGFARCHLCSFMVPCKGNHDAKPQATLRSHYARIHQGASPSRLQRHECQPSTVTPLSGDQEAVWQCKFCDHGISLEAAQSAGTARLMRDRQAHKQVFHPTVTWKAWRRASYTDRALGATRTRYANHEAVAA